MRNLSVIELENILGGCIDPNPKSFLEDLLNPDGSNIPLDPSPIPDWKDVLIWH